MLLVDRVLNWESGKSIPAIKNVTINEPFFQGHFPGHPIMPGVLIIEAMAQVGGMLLWITLPLILAGLVAAWRCDAGVTSGDLERRGGPERAHRSALSRSGRARRQPFC